MKRAFDLAVAAILLLALSPILIGVGLLVGVRMGRPVLFRQVRPGLGGQPFAMLKFRTMTDVTGSDGQLLDDRHRLTSFGRWLRSTSLDELPELWNVLRGDMSLVGPRPLLMEYLSLYNSRQARRHEVRPGITGWAQVNGRNMQSWHERLEADIWYVENQSFLLDLRILCRTLYTVLARQGVAAVGEATMPRFRGNSE